MHRVELKVYIRMYQRDSRNAFLMHRVELKASLWERAIGGLIIGVPNAPCGVERHKGTSYFARLSDRS